MNDKIPSTRWLRIITPVLIACIISFMDRVNISFALPGGMEADLGITSQMAGVASGIFFIGYLCSLTKKSHHLLLYTKYQEKVSVLLENQKKLEQWLLPVFL